MRDYALIFHPGPSLDPSDLPRRNAAAREWALALGRDGTLQVASPLEDAGFQVSRQGVVPVSRASAIASVLIVKARHLDEAVGLAQGHPGLAFGTMIEVRPIKAVAPASSSSSGR